MNTTTVSPKFQILIPKNVRSQMQISAGMKLEVIAYGDRIELIPLQSMKKMRGLLVGMDTTITRTKDRIWKI